jgi:oligopeptide transport system substrate-binding protein
VISARTGGRSSRDPVKPYMRGPAKALESGAAEARLNQHEPESGMMRRRSFLAGGSVALAACSRAEEKYFGNTKPPTSQRVVTTLDNDPPSLDPALSSGLIDSLILSMFEGLTSLQPATGAPMAALSTHYAVSPDGLQYTFYLRGHPYPRGRRLPKTEDLPREFSRGRSAPADAAPAGWSDGSRVTASDFVYSWIRVVDPATAAEFAYLLHPLRNARRISAGNLPPDRLGVRAINEYTFQADLEYLAPYFLELVSSRVFAAVPRHAIATAGERWTDPERIVCSGAFRLASRRAHDSIVLTRNPRYYDSGQVLLEELTVLVAPNVSTLVNQYRAGIAMLAYPAIPAILPALRRKRDFERRRNYGSGFLAINTRMPPFNDVSVRYALNMAIDKRPVADLFGGGWVPATNLVPAATNYEPPKTLPLTIGGSVYDVLSFNPGAARQLLSTIATPIPDRIEYIVPNSPDDILWGQVLKEQWRRNLSIDVDVRAVEFQTWIDTFHHGRFRHLAAAGSPGAYIDPTWFLDLFARPDGYGTHWSDPQYQAMLAQAKDTQDSSLRMTRLAECERCLLKGMPILPLGYWVDGVLKKPFLRGIGDNLLDRQQFKYVWIDTTWRPR